MLTGTRGIPFGQLPIQAEENIPEITNQTSRQYESESTGATITNETVGQEIQETGWQRPKLSPKTIIKNQLATQRRQMYEEWDEMRHQLLQMDMEHEKFVEADEQLKNNFRMKDLQLTHETQALNKSIDVVGKLIEEGSLPESMGQRALWRVAGLDNQQIDEMLPETKPTNWMKEHQAVRSEMGRLQSFIKDFTIKDGKVYTIDSKGEPVSPVEENTTQQFVMANNLLDYYEDYETNTIYPNLTPMQQNALLGTHILERQASDHRKRNTAIGAMAGGLFGPLASAYGAYKGFTSNEPAKEVKEAILGPKQQKSGVMVRTNPSTNERILSYDGGKTWQKV